MKLGKIRRPKSEGRPAATARQRGERKAEIRATKTDRAASGSGVSFVLSSKRLPHLSSPLCPLVCCLVCLCLAEPMVAAEPNGASDLPASSLNPPRGEIPPSVWEEYGGWIIAGSILAFAAIASGVWFLTRPKPEQKEPCVVAARRELKGLIDKQEDDALLVRTSQILHRYLAASFSMPGDQMTTREFCEGMSKNSRVGVDLARETSEFLQRCDVKKFAPAPPKGNLGAVATAMAIVDRAEQRLAHLHESAVAVGASAPQPKQLSGANGA